MTHRYATIHTVNVPELPLILVGATIFALVMALMYAVVGLYRPVPISVVSTAGRTIFALVVGSYITSLSLRSVADRGYIEQLLPAAVTYLVVGLVFVRGGMAVMRRVAALPRVLIVGTGPEALALAQRPEGDAPPWPRCGRFVSHAPTPMRPRSAPSRPACLRSQPVDRRPGSRYWRARDHRRRARTARRRRADGRAAGLPHPGIPVMDLAAYTESARGEVPIDSLKGSWLVYGHGFVQGRARQALKRAFDILSSTLLLVLLSPVMLLTAIAIKLDSRGPVLYRQERVGLGGRSFMCTKFRSMRVDAEHDGVARWASKNDPRITRIGTFLRKSRIDELPQLWSVFTGEMSLVGPAPRAPGFVEELKQQIPFYEIRHTVKPGITGWAQVRYPYGASMDDATAQASVRPVLREEQFAGARFAGPDRNGQRDRVSGRAVTYGVEVRSTQPGYARANVVDMGTSLAGGGF